MLSSIKEILMSLLEPLIYWIKTKIDARTRREERKIKALRDQQKLLRESLGSYKSDFNELINVGHTYDENWRRNKANSIGEWVRQHIFIFPECIRSALTGISNAAGTIAIRPLEGVPTEVLQACEERFRKLQNYLDSITSQLSGD